MREKYLLILLIAYIVSLPLLIYFLHEQVILLMFVLATFVVVIYRCWGMVRMEANDIKEKYSILTQAANDAIIIVNNQGKITYWNEAAYQMFGYRDEEILAEPWYVLVDQSQYYETFLAGLDKFKETGDNSGIIEVMEMFAVDKNGNEIPVELTVSTIKIKKQWHAVAVVRSIAERIRAEENIYKLAHFDSLTGLPNRISFNQMIGQFIYDFPKRGIGFAVMLMDLNQFKTVNDSLGHEIGDMLLLEVSKRLQNCFVEEDMIFRFGGDEFAILVREDKHELLEYYVNLLIAQFREPFQVKGMKIFSSVSVGVSVFPGDADDLVALVRNADTAMYHAKGYGHSQFQFYTPKMHQEETEKLAMHNDLQMALQRQEFILYYQPQVDLRSGDIVGVEALVRWRHPKLGMIPPAKFIPISEETGTIVEIGKWVLREACKQYTLWAQQGYRLVPIAVNISIKEFQNPCFIETLESTLKEFDMDANFLELEITESVAMFDVQYVIRILQELKSMGIKVAIDDFGMGFSSLNVLKMLPIDKLKIDRAFIMDIGQQQNVTDSAMIETFIALGKKLRLSVVAEGVETEEQKEFLIHNECDFMQGYLASPPVSAEQVHIFLKQQ